MIMRFSPGAEYGRELYEREIAPRLAGPPDGLVSHVMAETEDGVVVVDVWETEERSWEIYADMLRRGASVATAGPAEVESYPIGRRVP